MSSIINDLYCGDTLNTLGQEYHRFQWSQYYKWYLALPPTNKEINKVWILFIALVGCVPNATDFKELVLFCVDKFDTKRRIIQIQGNTPISLTPSVFKRNFRLSNSTTLFKNEELEKILKEHQGVAKLLENYLTNPGVDCNST
jgi:hypothetical protein